MERLKSKNRIIPLTQSSFVDCGDSIKQEDIKEEINEEESVDDPLSIQGDTTEIESKNIVAVLKEEVFRRYIILEMKRITQLLMKYIDIVEHKIEIYN